MESNQTKPGYRRPIGGVLDSSPSRTVVLAYLAVGAAWILASGQVADTLVVDPAQRAAVETVKGWLFVLVTALVLALLLRHRDRAIGRAQGDRLAQDRRLRFQANILEHVRDAVIVTGMDGRIVHWSPGARELFGYTESEMLGRTPDLLFETEEVDGPLLDDLLSTHPVGRDYPVRRRDGSTGWFDARTTPIVEESGAATATLIVIRDVTDRVTAEAAAVESEERFRAFMAHSPLQAFMKDAGGRYVFANSAFLSATGLEHRPDWLGRRDEELWDAAQAAATVAEDGEVMAADEPREFVRTVTTSTGERTLLVYKFPIRDRELRRYLGGLRIDVTEERRSRDELARLGAAIEQAADAIMVTDASERILYVNASLERLSGYERTELVGQHPGTLRSGEHDPSYYDAIREAIRGGRTWTGDLVDRRRDGTLYEQNTTISPVVDEGERLVGWVQVGRDVTYERELEAQLRQAQKMEAVGRLAGGIAHDFNNLLTAIGGYAELLVDELAPEDRAREDAAEIVRATDRAAQLTRQLLAFGRRQVFQLEVVDLNAIVRAVVPMLRRLIGEDVTLVTALAPDLGRVRADPGQLEQILVNLAVNARDAMPDGGTLTLETANHAGKATREAAGRRRTGSVSVGTADESAGSVVLVVADTGVGIDEQARQHIFEPFFTTKRDGRGTGLGLATVYGIVEQFGGSIEVESEPDQGAIFRIRLPRVDKADTDASTPGWRDQRSLAGTERILLVEDEPSVRRLALAALQRQGYEVRVAADAREALALADADPHRIDLLVTDVVMPGMSGQEMAAQLTASRPGLRVLFVSGYTEDAVVRRGVLDAQVNFLQKPFGPDSLARRVRDALDAPPRLA